MNMSTSVTQIIRTFAENMDLTAEPSADGSYSFLFEHSGALSFTNSMDGERVHVSLTRMPFRSSSTIERALMLQAGFDPTTNIFLHTGLGVDGNLVGVIDIENFDFDLPTVDQAFQHLVTALDACA